jgi:PAS domain S-box-containing protein
LVSTPLVTDGLTVASMSVLKAEPHYWTDQEIALVEDAGERTWAAVERARAEAALRESEERFRALVEPFAQATWEADGAGHVVTDSPSWRAYTGQTVEQWLGEGWAQAVHPDDQIYALHQWQDAVRTGTLVNAEYRLRSPNGSWRWTNARAAPLRNADATVRKWVGMNVDVTERRSAETALLAERQRLAVAEAVAAERRGLLKRIVRAQEEERAKVAHEVHDSLTQLAHAAAMHLDNALELMSDPDEPARVDVERGRDLTRQAANEARRLIAGLRPETLELIGLEGVLRQEVALLRAAGWEADLDDGDLTGLQIGGEAEIILYRVVQEALTNVRKHAWQARIRVLLKRLPHGVLLEVRDWGPGFDPGKVRATARGEHVGLTGMRERIELLGGTFQVSSRLNQGTIVRAMLPVPVLVDA